MYLSRSDCPSMQQGQQAAERRGAGGSGDAAGSPHQVGKQHVTQELLGPVTEMPGRGAEGQNTERGRGSEHGEGQRNASIAATCRFEDK